MLNNPLVIKNVELCKERYGKAEISVFAPGRVNIIGEHTDYNGGNVLPFSINQGIAITGTKTNSAQRKVYSCLFDEEVDIIEKSSNHWSSLINVALNILEKRDHTIGNFNLVVGGNLIHGSGLSSSSALVVGAIQMMNRLFELNLSNQEIIHLASRSEMENGVLGGIMDQTTIVHGKENHILHIDCAKNEISTHEIKLEDHQWMILDSKVKHNLVASDYNNRNRESKEALEYIKSNFKDVKSYKDISKKHLDFLRKENILHHNRAKHFFDEQLRVNRMLAFLISHNIIEAGKILYAGQESLKTLYEVSCPEIDFLIENLKKNHAVAGARMMGGGFGGAIIGIIQRGSMETILEELKPLYKEVFNKELNGYIVEPKDGLKVFYHE